jgi:hypothetical protein
MSATGETDGPEPDGRSDRAYFQAIEATFLRLRGSPLLLSPKDWRTAREWRRQGIPLELVERTLEEVFERRRERGEDRKISSLRYCARAVEAAWKRLRELTAPGERAEGDEREPFTAAPRLEALAAALPEGLPGRRGVAERVQALADEDDPRRIEEALGAIEAEVLDGLLAGLSETERSALEADADESLAPLADRMTREDAEHTRERLVRRKLRRRTGLPTLSLFAPEAEPPDESP